jgi:hypothetical protein
VTIDDPIPKSQPFVSVVLAIAARSLSVCVCVGNVVMSSWCGCSPLRSRTACPSPGFPRFGPAASRLAGAWGLAKKGASPACNKSRQLKEYEHNLAPGFWVWPWAILLGWESCVAGVDEGIALGFLLYCYITEISPLTLGILLLTFNYFCLYYGILFVP